MGTHHEGIPLECPNNNNTQYLYKSRRYSHVIAHPPTHSPSSTALDNSCLHPICGWIRHQPLGATKYGYIPQAPWYLHLQGTKPDSTVSFGPLVLELVVIPSPARRQAWFACCSCESIYPYHRLPNASESSSPFVLLQSNQQQRKQPQLFEIHLSPVQIIASARRIFPSFTSTDPTPFALVQTT